MPLDHSMLGTRLSTTGNVAPVPTASKEMHRATGHISAKKAEGHYLPTLDGWRAIAIIMVLLNHDRIYTVGPVTTEWFHRYGGSGVDIFFALSGLLICSRMLREEKIDGLIRVRAFYIRRMFRIQPAALVYLGFVTLLMVFGALTSSPASVVSAVFSVRNYLPLHETASSWYTAHFWSLGVEEQFYLFWPAFLILIRKHRMKILLVLIILLQIWRTIVFHVRSLQFGWEFGNRTDLRVTGILVGCVFAIALTRPRLRLYFVAAGKPWIAAVIVTAIWLASGFVQSTLMYLPICFTYVIVIGSTMLHPTKWISRLLEWAPMRVIGRLSYSVYLWQMLFFVHNKPVATPNLRFLAEIQSTGYRWVALVLVSLLSYFFVEKPLIRLGHKIAKRWSRPESDATPGAGLSASV